MSDLHREIGPASVSQAERQVSLAADPELTSRLLLGMALHETDREAAEELLRFCVRWRSETLRRAALVGIACLARRFGAVDGATWALVEAVDAQDLPADEGAASRAFADLRAFVADPPRWDRPVMELCGDRIDDFDGFVAEATRSLFPAYEAAIGLPWMGNLDVFNDMLRGGFGTPEDGFVLRWRHARHSRAALGWTATERWFASGLEHCHPDHRVALAAHLERARRHEGQTLFDILVGIIRVHGPGGAEAADLVLLELVED